MTIPDDLTTWLAVLPLCVIISSSISLTISKHDYIKPIIPKYSVRSSESIHGPYLNYLRRGGTGYKKRPKAERGSRRCIICFEWICGWDIERI